MYSLLNDVGTSQATILALSAARVKLFGTDVRKNGIRSLPEIRVYVSMDVHSCINKGRSAYNLQSYAFEKKMLFKKSANDLDLQRWRLWDMVQIA